jgi:formate-dependent nitrite reductase membrane component NrfD
VLDDTPSWGGEDYYGRPALKPAPFNSWVVGGYVFLAGLGGKVSLLTGLADWLRPAGADAMVERARYVPLAVPTLGAALLIYDLHTPQRFYNMFRVAKATSPMSIGTWLLAGYSLSSVASAVLQWLGFPRAAAAANAPAAVLGAGMGTYTAALLAATSTPLWAAAPRTLAARFASASFASAAATRALMEDEGPARRALDTVTALSLASELVLGGAQALALEQAGIADALGGGWGMVEKVGATGVGAALPLGLLVLSALGGGRGNLSRVASALALGGAFLLRVSTLEAGRRSASSAAISFRFAQPDNLPDVKRRAVAERQARRRARRLRQRPSG